MVNNTENKLPRAGPQELSDDALESVAGGTGSCIVHTVTHGETISMIARQYGVSARLIAQANEAAIVRTAKQHGIQRETIEEYSAYLYEGEQLLIPG